MGLETGSSELNDILIRGNVDLFERIVVNVECKDADSDKGPRASPG